MGRILKRVPLDFDWRIGQAWKGYVPSINCFRALFGKELPWVNQCRSTADICKKCPGHAEKDSECGGSTPYCIWNNPELKAKWYVDPPEGDGYQAWQDTTDPSPISPVFPTLDALCTWCAEHETVFASIKATPEEWKELLGGEMSIALTRK